MGFLGLNRIHEFQRLNQIDDQADEFVMLYEIGGLTTSNVLSEFAASIAIGVRLVNETDGGEKFNENDSFAKLNAIGKYATLNETDRGVKYNEIDGFATLNEIGELATLNESGRGAKQNEIDGFAI